MKLNVRSGRRSVCRGTLLLTALCSLTFLPDISHAQVGTEGTAPNERGPAQATPDERNPTQATTERMKEAQALYAPPAFVRREEHHRPHETYIGGFGGYTFGGSSFTNAQVAGAPSNGFILNDSGIYGLKIGHFLPDRLNWLGFEVEGFNTSPNIKQSANGPGGTTLPGASLRVTTLAFNAIIRGKFACGPSRNEPSRRTTTESHKTTTETQREVYAHEEDTFCPLQPYVGAGSVCSLPIRMDSVGATAHPIMRCPVSMGWLGSDTFLLNTSPFLGNTSTTAPPSISIMSAQPDRARLADSGAITRSITLSGVCPSIFKVNHVTLKRIDSNAPKRESRLAQKWYREGGNDGATANSKRIS